MKVSLGNVTATKAGLWEWVKALCTIALVAIFCYKVYLTPIDLTVDFPTLLSLLLAMFSVGLSALFYFKATETSNTFYDNTYNFTKDIAQLLVKIESGFGERLKNLDEGYSSMRDYLQYTNDKPTDRVEKTKKKIESEKSEMDKVLQERNEIVTTLFERSNLQEEEKTKVMNQLKEKEAELSEAQKELGKMSKRLLVERINKKRLQSFDVNINSGLLDFTKAHVLRNIGVERIMDAPKSYIIKRFNRIVDEFPRQYIEDLEQEGMFESGLNLKGYEFLRYLAEKEST